MNLTGRPVYVKGAKPKRSNRPTKDQQERWERIRALGCIVCGAYAKIHHCLTGAGGRKDHDKVIGLCENHHTGKEGLHRLSRRVWEPIYGYETDLMAKTAVLLGEIPPSVPSMPGQG